VQTGRLKTKKEFEEVLRGGVKRQGRSVSVFFLKNGKDAHRVGVIVARRNARTAVFRNYIKRVIYEFFRANRERVKKGYSIVVRYDGRPAGSSRAGTGNRIREDLEELSRKEKVIT